MSIPNPWWIFQVSSPLLVLHGAADKVTDPKVSRYLYEKASTEDKTLKLYEESYHSLLEGEPDDRIASVIDDIVSWLDLHSSPIKWRWEILIDENYGMNIFSVLEVSIFYFSFFCLRFGHASDDVGKSSSTILVG